MSLLGIAALALAAGIWLAWSAAGAALRRGGLPAETVRQKRLVATLLALVYGLVVLFVGAVPFLLMEAWTPEGGGASFIFLAWLGIGPVIAFIVLPAAYAILTASGLGSTCRRYCLPSLAAGALVLSVAYSLVSGGEAIGLKTSDVAILAVMLAAIFGLWLLYLNAMDWMGSQRS